MFECTVWGLSTLFYAKRKEAETMSLPWPARGDSDFPISFCMSRYELKQSRCLVSVKTESPCNKQPNPTQLNKSKINPLLVLLKNPYTSLLTQHHRIKQTCNCRKDRCNCRRDGEAYIGDFYVSAWSKMVLQAQNYFFQYGIGDWSFQVAKSQNRIHEKKSNLYKGWVYSKSNKWIEQFTYRCELYIHKTKAIFLSLRSQQHQRCKITLLPLLIILMWSLKSKSLQWYLTFIHHKPVHWLLVFKPFPIVFVDL